MLKLWCNDVELSDGQYLIDLRETDVPAGRESSGITLIMDETVDVQPFEAGKSYLITEAGPGPA